MKKFIALFLIIAITGLLVMSCGKEEKPNPDLTIESTTPAESTSVNPGDTTSTTTSTTYIPYVNDNYTKDENESFKVRVLKDDDGKYYGVAIANFKTAVENLTVPSTYTFNGTEYNVIQIGSGAQSQGSVCTGNTLKTLTVPSTVKSIGIRSFFMAKSLTTVNLAEGVESIGGYCFYICDELSSVTLPSTLKSIGEYAFWRCVNLESVVIPSSVTEIGTQAFSGCTNLKSVTLPRAFESQADSIFAACSSSLVITYAD